MSEQIGVISIPADEDGFVLMQTLYKVSNLIEKDLIK